MSTVPLVVTFLLGAVVCVLLLGLSRFVGPRRPTPVKGAPFECGLEPIQSARTQVSIKFSVVAMLFIIFDIEVAFLYPWAVLIRQLHWAGFAAVAVFLFVLSVAFAYAWKRGALEWS